MLKLNASFSKKVPADEEYSSKSYHASVEVELPDGLSGEQLRGRIHETFQLVRDSVESELRNGTTGTSANGATNGAFTNATNGSHNGNHTTTNNISRTRRIDEGEPASNKQIKYLLDLCGESCTDVQSLLRSVNVESVYKLTKAQCSQLIDGITGNTRRKAA